MSWCLHTSQLDLAHNDLLEVGSRLDNIPLLDDLDLSANPRLDVASMPSRVRRLHDKKQLFRSKDSRRVLIQRGLGVRKGVMDKEQQAIEKAVAASGRTSDYP